MSDIISALSDLEKRIIFECLLAAEQTDIFPEWEFETLLGMEKSKLIDIRKKWPEVDTSLPDVGAAIIGSMNQLLGYPHAQDGIWERFISFRSDAVKSTLDKLIFLGL